MKELFDKVFAILLSPVDSNSKRKILEAISVELITDPFLRQVHEACSSLMESSTDINVLSVVMKFKEKNLYQKDTAIKVSKLTIDFNSTMLLDVTGVIGALNYYDSLRKAKKLIQELQVQVETENFTDAKFLDTLESGKAIVSSPKSTYHDNIELWSKVMIKHDEVAAGAEFGLQLPYGTLRRAIALEPVDFMVVGARPAMGKTAFCVSTAVQYASQGKRVAIFALEMSAEQIMRRIMGCLSGVDTLKIKYGTLSDSEQKTLYRAQDLEYLKNIFVFDGSHSIGDIYSKVSDLKINGGVDVIIIDYLQKVISRKQSRYEQVTEVSNKLKMLSQDLKIPCIAMAQLSRDSGRSGKIPVLPDLRESGEIEQDASVVAFLHRPEYYGEPITLSGNPSDNICEFVIAKNREGIIDIYELSVDLATSTFKDVNSLDKVRITARVIDVDYSADNPY